MKKYRIELKWALIFVAMTLVWMLLERLAGLHGEHIGQHPTYTNLIAIPAIAIYVLALLEKRKKAFDGKMTWQQGFVTGLIISVIVAALSPLTQLIVSKVITPDYFPNAIKHAVTSGKMDQTTAETYFNLQSYILQGIIGALVMGLLTSALVAIFTRKG